MGLVDIIKKLFNKKTKVINHSNNKDIISYNTSKISLPKYSKLSKEAKEKVIEYIKELNIDELKTIVKYGDKLYKDANDITNLLLKLYFRINEKPFESELNKLSEQDILEKRIEALILLEELKDYYKELHEINNECILRAIALKRYRNKFELVLKETDKSKREENLKNLENAFNDFKLCKRRIDDLIEVVKREIGNNFNMSISLEEYNKLRKINNEKNTNIDEENINKEIVINKLKELIPIIEIISWNDAKILKNLINLPYNEEEYIKAIAMCKREIDLYAYQNKDKIEELNSRVLNLLKCKKSLENRSHFIDLIERMEEMYKVLGSYLQEEHLLNFYELKLNVLCIDIKRTLLFQYYEDKKAFLYYQKIIELKLYEILNGKNKYFQEEFGENQERAIGLLRKIIKDEIGDFSGEKILKNRKVLAFITAFDKEDGLSEFIKINYFDETYLRFYRPEYRYKKRYYRSGIIYYDSLPLKTIYQLEDLVGNIDEKYTSLNVWVELLKFGCVSAKIEKIENILENGEIVLNLPLGICIINRVRESSRIDHIHFGKIRDILSNAEFIILNDDLLEIGDLGFENHKNLKRIIIPKSTSFIGRKAFLGCENLSEFVINERTPLFFCDNLGDHIFDEIPNDQINLIVQGIRFGEIWLESYIDSMINNLKSIEIMDGDVVAVHYDVKKYNIQEIIQEINRKLEEYKRYKNNEINKVKKITL